MAGQLSAILESFRKTAEPAREQIEKWQGEFNSYARKRTEQLYRTVLASPAVFIILLIVIAAFLGQRGLDFQSQIEDDVEIFLPDGAESTDLLLEVREEWSTDIAVIYIQTDNARLGGGLGDNITDEAILREIVGSRAMMTTSEVPSQVVEWTTISKTTGRLMEFCGLFHQLKS